MENGKNIRNEISNLEKFIKEGDKEKAKNLLHEIVSECSDKLSQKMNILGISVYSGLVIEAVAKFLGKEDIWKGYEKEIKKLREQRNIEDVKNRIEAIFKKLKEEINDDDIKNLVDKFLASFKDREQNPKKSKEDEKKPNRVTIRIEGDFNVEIDKGKPKKIVITYY